MKQKRAGLALALVAVALSAPTAAHGQPTGDDGPARAVGNVTAPAEVTAFAGRSSVRLRPVESGVGRAVGQQAVGTDVPRGLGRQEAVIGVATVIGILLFGLWGDAAVGALMAGAAAGVGAGARLVTRNPRGDRAGTEPGRRPRRSSERSGVLRPASGQEGE